MLPGGGQSLFTAVCARGGRVLVQGDALAEMGLSGITGAKRRGKPGWFLQPLSGDLRFS